MADSARKPLGHKTPPSPARRLTPRAPFPAVPPSAKGRKPLIIGLSAGGAVVLAVIAAVALSGSKPSRPDPAPVAEPAKPLPKVVKTDAAAPPSARQIEEQMKREAEEARRKFLEEDKKRRDAADKKAAAEKERAEAEARSKAAAEETAKAERKGAYETRKRERLNESKKRLDEAKRTLEDDRKAEIARQKAITEKLKNLKLTLKMKNGLILQNVAVQAMTRDEIKLAFTFEGASAEQAFPIEFIADRSYVELMNAVYKGGGAPGFYEMGRQLVLRKLWKDAQAAFAECVKLDAAYGPRVPDISRILNNEAAFKGSARRIGADQLLIAYDFSDASMAQDFTPHQVGQMSVEGGELKISSKGTALWSLKDVDFTGDLEVDLVAIFEETSSLVLGGFMTADRKGYLAVINSRTPAGNYLYRCEGAKVEPFASQKEPKVQAGVETRIRMTIRGGAIRVYMGDQEAVAASDSAHSKGWLGLGVAAGTLRIKKMTVQGRVNPLEIDKRFAEVEVLVRRALESDLGRKKGAEEDVDPLSGEDEFFLSALDPAVRAEYEKARPAIAKGIQRRRLPQAQVKEIDALVSKAPDFGPVHYWKGHALLMQRRSDEARQSFERALKADPDFHEARRAVAQTWLDEYDLGTAAREARKALDGAPGDGETMALIGFVKFVLGDTKGALADLELSRKLDPSSEYALQAQRNVQNVIKGPQHLGAKHVKEFPHYVVMTDMSPEKTVLYGTRLEAAYKHYAEVFKDVFAEDPKRPKPRVAIFNTREAYLTYGELTLSGRQEWTLGYFHPFYKELLLFEDVDLDATLHTLYHEAFHQFMSMMIPRAPYWYNEGIAEYMGGLKVEIAKNASKIVERARLLEGRLRVLKVALASALKFEEIMMQSPGQFYSGPVSFKYAQAWSMVHFFYEAAGGKHRARIESYFRKLKEGGTPREAFQSGFGDANLDELQKEWADYVKKLEIPKK